MPFNDRSVLKTLLLGLASLALTITNPGKNNCKDWYRFLRSIDTEKVLPLIHLLINSVVDVCVVERFWG